MKRRLHGRRADLTVGADVQAAEVRPGPHRAPVHRVVEREQARRLRVGTEKGDVPPELDEGPSVAARERLAHGPEGLDVLDEQAPGHVTQGCARETQGAIPRSDNVNGLTPRQRETCPRCGAALLPLEELHRRAIDLADASVRLAAAYSRMRLVVPQALLDAMRQIEREAPALSLALACVAGRCRPTRSA